MRARAALLSGLLLLGACAGNPAPAKPKPLLREVDSTDLQRTVVLPQPDQPIPEGKNALWCATAPIAWDELCTVNKAPLDLGPPAPKPVLDSLNRRDFPRAALDPACFVAMGGRGVLGIEEKIAKAMAEKFGDASPRHPLPPIAPQDAVGYAFLRKNLPFTLPFWHGDAPMGFNGGAAPVANFRIPSLHENPRRDEVQGQVGVLFTDGKPGAEHQFAVELSLKGGRDRLVLARIASGASLRETWGRAVAREKESKPGSLPPDSDFIVPMMRFDLTHHFRDLEGAPFRSSPVGLVFFRVFEQSILLDLTEEGVKVESQAIAIAIKGGVESPRVIPPSWAFDRPFLLALIEKGADTPYLLFWVENDELLAVMP